MKTNRLLSLSCGIGLLLLAGGEAVAKGCIHAWAVPGRYTISGNFRGKVETAGGRLTRDCKIILQVPGVFSGTKVRKAGRCLRFGFKVQGVKKAFKAKWCKGTGTVPWNGKNIRVRIKLVKRGPKADTGPRPKQNFNLPK